jgi:hypothetical protein
MTVPDAAVSRLHRMCGLDPAACRTVLAAHDVDPLRALFALVSVGIVRTDDLDPDDAAIPDEVFGFASDRALFFPSAVTTDLAEAVTPAIVHKYREDNIDWTREARKGGSIRATARTRRRITRLASAPVVVDLPPFPSLTLTLDEWTGRDAFPEWAGFHAGDDDYDDRPDDEKARAVADLQIPRLPGDEDDTRPRPPSPEQRAAYAHLKTHSPDVRDAVLRAYRDLLDKIRSFGNDVPDAAEAPSRMRLSTVRVTDFARDGQAYVTLLFAWSWDEEHALDFTIHGSRVVGAGSRDPYGGETAAEEDGGQQID